MKIEFGIQSNCSEATMRILLKGQDTKQTEALIERLRLECEDDYPLNFKEWDEDEKKKEFDFYETSVYEEVIFGVKVLTIKGDAPYNSAKELEKLIKKYLPKAKIEFEE